jgi:hypothetical protein
MGLALLLPPLILLFGEFDGLLSELLNVFPNGFSFEAADGSPEVVDRRRVGFSVNAWSSALGIHDENITNIKPPTKLLPRRDAPFKFFGVDLFGARSLMSSLSVGMGRKKASSVSSVISDTKKL